MRMTDIVNVGIATVDAIGRNIDSFPEPGGLVMFETLHVTTGGCAVNCAIDLAKMGIASSLIVKVGQEMLGDFVLAEATKYGIDISRCRRDPAANTAYTFVAVESRGERRFFHAVGSNATFRAEELDVDFVTRHRLCYVGGAMVMPGLDGAPLAGVLAKIRAGGTVTVLDTVYVNQPTERWRQLIFPVLPHLDYFVPSEPEANALSGRRDPADIAAFLRDHGAINVVVKLGEKGVYYSLTTGESGLVPAYRVPKVVDTTGAGDAWDAGFLAGLSMGQAVAEACRLGNATAAFCIQAAGASTGVPALSRIQEFQRSAR